MYTNSAQKYSCELRLVLTVGFSTNALVVSFLAMYISLKKNHLDTLPSLFVTDLLTLILILFNLASPAQQTWLLGDILCKIFQLSLAFFLLLAFTLCFISITRTKIIPNLRAPKSATAVLVLILAWALTLVINLSV